MNIEDNGYSGKVYGDDYVPGSTYIMVASKVYDVNDILDIGIAFVTGFKFIHTELIYEEDGELIMVSSSPGHNGVRKARHKVSSKYTYYRLCVTPEFIYNMKRFFFLTEGAKYDIRGILGFIIPTQDRNDKWFCSEYCSTVLKINSYEHMFLVEPSRTSPGALATILGIPNKISRWQLLRECFFKKD